MKRTEMIGSQRIPAQYHPNTDRIRENGSKPCECGRTISANKEKCAACAGVKFHPTSLRAARKIINDLRKGGN